jgi:hypothetical protein
MKIITMALLSLFCVLVSFEAFAYDNHQTDQRKKRDYVLAAKTDASITAEIMGVVERVLKSSQQLVNVSLDAQTLENLVQSAFSKNIDVKEYVDFKKVADTINQSA